MKVLIFLTILFFAEQPYDRPSPGLIIIPRFETDSIIELLRVKKNFAGSVSILELQRENSRKEDLNRQFDTWDEYSYHYFRKCLKLELE